MAAAQVLIVGAGPTGLVLALRLAHAGIAVRIVAKSSGPGTASRAMAVQARTLEFYQQLGFGDAVAAAGIQIGSARLREHGRDVAELAFGEIGRGISPFPFILSYPQDDHERFLIDRLADYGVAVEWNTALTGFDDDGDRVRATLDRDGQVESTEVAYLAGCDGAHSIVRERLGSGFPGGTYDQRFFVADVAIDAPAAADMLMHLGSQTLLLMFPVRSSGMQRLIGVVPPELGDRELTFEDIRPTAEAMLAVAVTHVNWFSSYRVHHRVVDHFRRGRVFLAGDAAHLHSPAGGQGMNTGIGDAVNLGWKLADVLHGRVGEAVLDSYEAERIAFARRLVETTDRVFANMVGDGWTSTALRRWIVPNLLPVVGSLAVTRRAMFATLSQTRIHYRDSDLSEGRAGDVHGGDRLPWTGTNYAGLDGRSWRLHSYGEPPAGLDAAAAALDIPRETLPFDRAAADAGFGRDGSYLIRPDGHVAAALREDAGAHLTAYAERIGLRAA